MTVTQHTHHPDILCIPCTLARYMYAWTLEDHAQGDTSRDIQEHQPYEQQPPASTRLVLASQSPSSHAGHETWPWNERLPGPEMPGMHSLQRPETTASSKFPTSCSYIYLPPLLYQNHLLSSIIIPIVIHTLQSVLSRRSRILRSAACLAFPLSPTLRTDQNFIFPLPPLNLPFSGLPFSTTPHL